MSEARRENPAVPHGAQIMTRIYIQPDGNVVVTDYWKEIERLLGNNFTTDDEEALGETS